MKGIPDLCWPGDLADFVSGVAVLAIFATFDASSKNGRAGGRRAATARSSREKLYMLMHYV